MRLFYSPTSPYARKARIVVREKGLLAEIEEVVCDPWSDMSSSSAAIGLQKPAELRNVNPLGRVPALVARNGAHLFDSPVICAYLNDLAPAPALIPAGDARFGVLAAEALSDGTIDTAVNLVLENRRPEAERSAKFIARWLETIGRAVAALDAARSELPGTLTQGHIAIAVALSYLDFRLPQMNWREGHDALTAWHKSFAARPSMLETAPPQA